MADDFPATKQAVGEEAFAGFVSGYLQKYPSTSYSLGVLHRNFVAYLEESRPARDTEPHAPDWVDFIIDLATLESTYCDTFDGPGEEGLKLLSPESLAQLSPEQWMHAQLKTADSLKLLHFRFPVQVYASAVRKGEPATMPAPHETWLAVHRRDFIVRRRPLTQRQFRLLQALQAGQTVSAAIARSLADPTGAADTLDDASVESLSRQMQNDFREWAIEGYFRAVE